MRDKTIKLIKDNMGEYFHDPEIGKDFLTVHKKVLLIKIKVNKLKTSLHLKTPLREWKGKPQEEDNYFQRQRTHIQNI